MGMLSLLKSKPKATSTQAQQPEVYRQNPDLLENGSVVENHCPQRIKPGHTDGSGIMNAVEMRAAIVAMSSSHPLTNSSFQRRVSSTERPQNPRPKIVNGRQPAALKVLANR